VERGILIKPMAKVSTDMAGMTAPTQIRELAPLGWVAVGGSIEKKNPAGIRIAESGTPTRTNQARGEGRTAASTRF
jgi:hypothetical protein